LRCSDAVAGAMPSSSARLMAGSNPPSLVAGLLAACGAPAPAGTRLDHLAVGPASLARLIRQPGEIQEARQASAQCLTTSAGSQPAAHSPLNHPRCLAERVSSATQFRIPNAPGAAARKFCFKPAQALRWSSVTSARMPHLNALRTKKNYAM
jgi:hypothetical protein